MSDKPKNTHKRVGCCQVGGIICVVISAALFWYGYYLQEFTPNVQMKNLLLMVYFYLPSAFFGFIGFVFIAIGTYPRGKTLTQTEDVPTNEVTSTGGKTSELSGKSNATRASDKLPSTWLAWAVVACLVLVVVAIVLGHLFRIFNVG